VEERYGIGKGFWGSCVGERKKLGPPNAKIYHKGWVVTLQHELRVGVTWGSNKKMEKRVTPKRGKNYHLGGGKEVVSMGRGGPEGDCLKDSPMKGFFGRVSLI